MATNRNAKRVTKKGPPGVESEMRTLGTHFTFDAWWPFFRHSLCVSIRRHELFLEF